MVLASNQHVFQRFPRMNSTFESTVHSTPELYALRSQIWSYGFVHFRPVEWIDVLIQMIRHISPEGKCLLRQPQIQTILLAISDKRSELARHNVIVQDQQKALVEFECVVALLHQLPSAI